MAVVQLFTAFLRGFGITWKALGNPAPHSLGEEGRGGEGFTGRTAPLASDAPSRVVPFRLLPSPGPPRGRPRHRRRAPPGRPRRHPRLRDRPLLDGGGGAAAGRLPGA